MERLSSIAGISTTPRVWNLRMEPKQGFDAYRRTGIELWSSRTNPASEEVGFRWSACMK
jgi:hypothetical protein